MADRRARFVENIAGSGEGLAYGGVGADLRQARERMGLDLADVAVALRIQFVHLDAVERGQFQELPGPAYAIGFIRSYARYLLLDGDAAVAQFKAETSIAPGRGRLIAPEPLGEARRPRGLLILASLALIGAVYGGWVWLQERERLAIEPVPAPPQGSLGQSQGAPAASSQGSPAAPAPASLPAASTSASPAPVSPAPAVAPPQPALQSPAAAPTSGVPIPPASGVLQPGARTEAESQANPEAADDDESTPPPSPNAPEPPTLAAAPQPPAGASTAQVFGLENQDARVVLRARADSWVRIRGANNELVLERTLRTGDTYLVPNRPDLVLWTGNAGGLEVIVDGAPQAPLGASGAARRDIQLDPDRLRRGGG